MSISRSNFIAAIVAGMVVLASPQLSAKEKASEKAYKLEPHQKLAMVERIIEGYYLDEVDGNKITEEAIVAMLKTLDPHSAYTNAEETKEMLTALDGNFSGIGIQFNMLNDTLVVIQTTSGGPSERVGLLPGDKILSADGKPLSGAKIPNSEVLKTLRGAKGTRVNVAVKRRNVPDSIMFHIVRDDIPVYSIDAAYMADEQTGYVRISRFAETTGDELEKALKKLKKQGMKQLIIDLEDNGGGYIGSAVEVTGNFLKKGDCVTYTESPKMGTAQFSVDKKGSYDDMPLVVMVNQYSASASEICSGAIQDYDRGVIVGRRTFGKGLVQRPFPLPDGSMVKLTVSRYHTPSGRVIQRPYEEGNADGYYSDLKARVDNGELYEADKMVVNDSLAYKTLRRGRTVYGGGGIIPDVFVPVDTTYYTTYYRDLMAKGVFNSFCLSYVNEHRVELKSDYGDEDAFVAKFAVTQSLLESFKAAGVKEGVEVDEELYERSLPAITAILKGIIGRDLFETSTYFRIVNPILNPVYREALILVNDKGRCEEILSGNK